MGEVDTSPSESTMESWLQNWLHVANVTMSRESIPYAQRPFESIRRLSDEQNISIAIPSPLTTDIFKWFENHSPADAHMIGSLFTSVLYYDTYFWKLEIPVAYGTVQLNALDALFQMPLSVKEQLREDRTAMWQFVHLWVDSMDYGYGIDDLGYGKRLPQKGNREFAAQLAASAHHALRACVQLLTEPRAPNVKAIESARMATEMFLKAYLAIHTGLNTDDAQKKFGHNLEKLALACQFGHGLAEFTNLAQHMSVFPPVAARYEGVEYDPDRLWSGYAIALRTGVTFTRAITDRDNRAQMLGERFQEPHK